MEESSIPIQFEPHFHTLTDSGRSHFLRPVDAIAEFVDNSIQACRDVASQRLISLKFFYDRHEQESYLMVADNGCGLNTREIEEFATFSLDQKTRGNIPQEHDDSFISKFGVGSKQAGFFLGNRITLITKKQQEKTILKFVFDYQKFAQKYKSKENVYNDIISRFPVMTNSQLDSRRFFKDTEPECHTPALLREIQQHINNHSEQFAIFLIKLRPEMREKLRRKQELSGPAPTSELVRELADIYYFHLHPQNQLEQLEQLFPNLSNPNKGNNERRGKRHHTSTTATLSSSALAPLHLYYAEYENGLEKINKEINQCTDNFLSQCILQAKDIFPFELEIPDSEKSTTNTEMTTKYPVQGCIFYYPVLHGKESIPTYYSMNPSSGAGDPENLTQLTESSSKSETLKDNRIATPAPSLFQVFWVNRLVPEAVVQKLNFLPSKEMVKIDELTEKNWRQRIVGLLFLPRSFEYISNNKLKICLEPERWINHPDTMVSHPRKAKEKFKKWIETCYKQFDKEFIFVNRIEDESRTDHARFSSVLTIREDSMTEISVGEVVKWKMKDQMIWLGKILDFEIHRSLPKVDKSYSGTGKFHYHRLPTETYGDMIYSASLEVLDSSDYLPKKSDYDLLEKISDLKFYLFPSLGAPGVELTNDGEVIANSVYSKVGIQILNQWNQPMNALPQMVKNNQRYWVELATNDDNIIGETADLTEFLEATQKDVLITKGLTSKELVRRKCYYGFEKMTFQKQGKLELIATVKVMSTAREKLALFSKRITIRVVTPEITLVLLDPNKLLRQVVTLGESWPSFEIGFIDENDQAVSYTGEVKVHIACVTDPKLSCKAAKRPSSLTGNGNSSSNGNNNNSNTEHEDLIIIEDERQLLIDGSLWIPNPTKSTALFSKEEYLPERSLVFQLNLLTDTPDEEAKSNKAKGKRYDHPIFTEPLEFTLRFRPGIPKSLVLLSQEKLLEIKNNSIVELLAIGFIDSYGYRTSLAPLTDYLLRQSEHQSLTIDTESWQMEIGEDGPLSVSINTTTISFNSTDQTISIHNLLCEMPDLIPPAGKETTQTFSLCCKVDVVNHLIHKLVQPVVVPMKVYPSFTPARLCLYWQGKEIQDSEILARLAPGQTLSELSFDLLDSDGNSIEDELYQEAISDTKGSWLHCSWVSIAGPVSGSSAFKSKKKRYPPLPAQRVLADLVLPTKLPTSSSESEMNYKVKVSFNEAIFEVHFSVVVEVKEGVAWQLVYDSSACEAISSSTSKLKANTSSSSQGFLLFRKNDITDFLKKIVGVCLVDGYDNCITSKEILAAIASPPVLAIYRLTSISTEPTPDQKNDVYSIAEVDSTKILLGEFPLTVGKLTPAVNTSETTVYGSEALSLSQMMDGEEEDGANDIWGFVLPLTEIQRNLALNEAIGTTLLLTVRDSQDHYLSHEMTAKVIAGYPVAAAFLHPLCPHPIRSLALELSRYSKLSNLRILLLDTIDLTEQDLQQMTVQNSNTISTSIISSGNSYDYRPDLTGIHNLQVEIIDSHSQSVIYSKKTLISPEITIPSLSLPVRDRQSSSSRNNPVRRFKPLRRTMNSGRKRRHQEQMTRKRSQKRPKTMVANRGLPVDEEEEDASEIEAELEEGEIKEILGGEPADPEDDTMEVEEAEEEEEEHMIRLQCHISYEVGNTAKSLPPLDLLVELIRINRVTGLTLTPLAAMNNIMTEMAPNRYRVEYEAGVIPDHFLLVTQTEDSQIYLPSIDQLELKITRDCQTVSASERGNKKNTSTMTMSTETLRIEKVFELHPSPTSEGIILQPLPDFWSTHIAAEYHCTIVYHESRPSLVSTLPRELLSQTISLEIIIKPGEIQELVFDSDSLEGLEHLSLMMNSASEHRFIGREISVMVVDQYDNRCNIPSSERYQLQCFIQPLKEEAEGEVGEDPEQQNQKKQKRNQQSQSVVPSLYLEKPATDVTSGERGMVLAKWNSQQSSYYFPLLRLQYDPQYLAQLSPDHPRCRYELCFALYDTATSRDHCKKKFPFDLVSNMKLLERKKELEERLLPLLRDTEAFQKLKEELRGCNGKLESQKGKLSNVILCTNDDIAELENLQKDHRKRLNDIKTQIRPPKKQGFNGLDPAVLKKVSSYVGVVVDLAAVDDEIEAKIVSWAAREVMDAAVVQSSDDGNTLYRLGIPSMILEQCPPFMFTDSRNQARRERDADEKATSRLPLPPILVTNEKNATFPPPGNPEYLVNLLKLSPDKEHLRDSLFFNIFQKSIIFDDLEQASSYRKYLVQRQLPVMPIYSRKGEMIPTRAFLDPRPSARCPPNLDLIFGESNRLHHPEYQMLQQEIQLIDDRVALIQQRMQLVQQLGRFTQIEEMMQEIEEIRRELHQLED